MSISSLQPHVVYLLFNTKQHFITEREREREREREKERE